MAAEAAGRRAAVLLFQARREHRPLVALPAECAPNDLNEAYIVQAQHVALLCETYEARPIGYKIGCTNETAQALLGLDEPFHGRLLDRFSEMTPAALVSASMFMCCVEAEIAFRMAESLPDEGAPYAQARVAQAVGAVLPALEIVDSRYEDWTRVGAPAIIADNGSAGRWVHGAEIPDWQQFDLAKQGVRLLLNGGEIRVGTGANVMGGPLVALTWLANDLARGSGGLAAGDLISTGTCIEVYFASPGDRLEADFGSLGRVAVEFS